MKKEIIHIVTIFFVVITGGCISEFTADLPYYDQHILVVEGNIVANSEVQFYFSRTFPMNTEEIDEYKDVEVDLFVIGSNGYRSERADYLGEGVHRVLIGELNENETYGIEFEYQGNLYRSELSHPLYTPVIDSVTWVQNGEYGAIGLYISTHEDSQEQTYFIWNLEEDWRFVPFYYTEYTINTRRNVVERDPAAVNYYCWKKGRNNNVLIGTSETLTENRIIDKKLIEYDASDERFVLWYSTLIKQRRIDKGTYEYYLNKSKANQDMGGLFSSQPSEIESNIYCETDPSQKVIGYIYACMNVVEKRISIDRDEVTTPDRVSDCNLITWEEIYNMMEYNNFTYTDLYNSGYRPIGSEALGVLSWARVMCADCVVAGGSLEIPDFWENENK